MTSEASTQTVQQFLDTGDTYYWFCKDAACKVEHGDIMEPLDMLRSRDKYGPDHGGLAPDILPRMHCTRCGGWNVGLIREAKGNTYRRPKDQPAVNPYLKAKGG